MKKSFEENITRIEEIISMLEKDQTNLKDSLDLFSEGTAIIKECSVELETAEQKIKLIQGE